LNHISELDGRIERLYFPDHLERATLVEQFPRFLHSHRSVLDDGCPCLVADDDPRIGLGLEPAGDLQIRLIGRARTGRRAVQVVDARADRHAGLRNFIQGHGFFLEVNHPGDAGMALDFLADPLTGEGTVTILSGNNRKQTKDQTSTSHLNAIV